MSSANKNPQFGVPWRRKIYSLQTAQLWYNTRRDVRWPWGKNPVQLDSSPSCECTLPCTGLRDVGDIGQGDIFPVFQLLSGKGKWPLRAKRELIYVDRSPQPWFLICPSSCKWRFQILKVWVVRKALYWLIRMESFSLVDKKADGDIAV